MSDQEYEWVSSDLFRAAPSNPIDWGKVREYQNIMIDYGNYGPFPPIEGWIGTIDEDDLEEYQEAEEMGYRLSQEWSRDLREDDIDVDYTQIRDGHHRAWAAKSLGYDIKVVNLNKTEESLESLLNKFSDSIESNFDLENFYISYIDDETIELNLIEVPKDKRGEGIGSQVMEEIVDFADAHGLTVILTAEDRGTSKKKLYKFYKGFGFVENKGMKKIFRRCNMYRYPKN